MHWTALIEKRYFPAHAQVIEDVACVGCGYNLHHARAAGPCPECGRPVADSLWSLANPGRVAGGLRSVGKSYLGLGALVLVPLAFLGGACAGWGVALAVVTTAVVRASGVGELRFRAEIDHMPVVGPRVRLLWRLALLDVALALAWSVTLPVLLARATVFGGGATFVGMALTAWLGATFALAGVAGWMGTALAAMLGYEGIARTLRVQWMLIIAGPALAVAVTVAGLIFAGLFDVRAADVALGAAVLSLAVTWIPAGLLTFMGMLQLANAAEHERNALDDLVDAERTHREFHRTDDEDLPDIRIDQDPAP